MASNQKTFFLRRKWQQTQAWYLIFSILGPAITPVFSEWVSILDRATVMPVLNLDFWSSAKENLISKSFKAGIFTNSDNYSNWYTIDLDTPQKVIAAFVITNSVGILQRSRFGTSYICMGDDPTDPKSASNSCTTTAFYYGGFFELDLAPGRYFFFH